MVEKQGSKRSIYPKVREWFLLNPKYLILIDPSQNKFLQQKSVAAAQLAVSSSRGDFIQLAEHPSY